MEHADRERLIDIVIWGRLAVAETTADDRMLHFTLHPPTPEIKARSALVYQTSYDQSVAKGMSTEDELLESFVALKQWNPQTDIEIDGLKKDIHNIRKGLLDFLFQKDRLEQARSLLRRAENALMERMHNKQKLLIDCAENYALIQQQRYILGRITYAQNGELYWPTEEAFDEEVDIGLVNKLSFAFFEKSRISTKAIRCLARTSPWTTLWKSSKGTIDLFGKAATELTENQKELFHWSYVYDMVDEAHNRPISEIINDDDLLDSWFIRQSEEIENNARQDSIPDSAGRHDGRQEQFIMTDAKGSQGVYKMNDNMSRAKIKAKQKILHDKKRVREQDLPESRLEIRQLAVQMNREKIKNISRKK